MELAHNVFFPVTDFFGAGTNMFFYCDAGIIGNNPEGF